MGAALALQLGVLGAASCHDWGQLSRAYGGGDDAGPGNGCPSGRGPEMVRIQASGTDFCIDSTEVTAAQYAEFVASPETKPGPPDCEWKGNTYNAPVPLDPEHPVRSVDHCDARAFCVWAGKRLCAGVGEAQVWSTSNALESEWLFACSHGGALEYPYGPGLQEGLCSFLVPEDGAGGEGQGAVRRVDADAGCEGGFDGVFDMTGNVWEWIDSCDPGDAGPESDGCYFMGGAYGQPADTVCSYRSAFRRDRTEPDVGLRCCATPE